ncbi:MAG: 2-phospho-L-lactate guanylyltransferase [Solirubrobacterales bacterium]|nr:2-phospho-L-lactate guanylyltransferase [Solirubrobacterales bacterium]
MRAVAIVPVKRFAAAKTRLAGTSASAARPELVEAMLGDVLASLRRSEALDAIIVVTGEPAARTAAEGAGAMVVGDPDDGGHSPAARLGVRAAVSLGASCVALLPGDCPLVSAAELDAALAAMAEGVAAVIPDRHGSGTNGLLLAPPDAIEPAFGPGSRERHLALAREAGVEPRVLEIPSLALDLDTEADLGELAAQLRAEPAPAPATAAALRSIGPFGGEG